MPVRVQGLSDITAVSSGAGHSIGLKSDGSIWSFGDNSEGQLGNGTTRNSYIPVQTISITNPPDISDTVSSGLDRVVSLNGGFIITFQEITSPGVVFVSSTSSAPASTPDGFRFRGYYFDISTTAEFTGD